MKKQTKTSQKITKSMTIAEVIGKYPKAVPILMKYGLHCIGCPMAMQETLEQGLAGHGANINKIIDELNKKAGKK